MHERAFMLAHYLLPLYIMSMNTQFCLLWGVFKCLKMAGFLKLFAHLPVGDH